MKSAIAASTLLALAACDHKHKIKDGNVYQKAHTVKISTALFTGTTAMVMMNIEVNREVVNSPTTIHEEIGESK